MAVRAGLPSDHVVRPRLTRLLDRGLERRLTLVSAPAGCGKTTLLSAWDPPGYLVARVTLDERADNLRDFVREIVGTVQILTRSSLRATLSLLLLADQLEPAVLAARLADELAGLPDRVAIILDDFHVLRDRDVHSFVSRFTTLIGQNTRLVIATREAPPLPLATLRARAQVAEVGLEQLGFTRDETQALLDAAVPFVVEPAVADQLTRRSDGWVAGLRLATLMMSSEHPGTVGTADLIARGMQHAHTFIIDDILSAQPTPLQDELLRSSILDRFCGSLLDALDDEPNRVVAGEAWIDKLTRANLFVTALDADGVWHRLHQLFREALHGLLLARSGPDLVATLHRRASAWFANEGMIAEAIRHALAAGEPGQAARLVEEGLRPLLDREGDPGHLEAWIRLLPVDLADHDPVVLLARAWLARLRGRMALLPELLPRVEAALDEDTSRDDAAREALRGVVSTLWGFAWYVGPDRERMVASTEAAIQRVPRYWRRARGQAEFLHATALVLCRREDEARAFLAACRSDLGPADGPRLALVLAVEARQHAVGLRIRDLAHTASEMLMVAQADRLTQATVIGRFFAGLASYERNALDEARDHFGTGIGGPVIAVWLMAVDNVLGLALSLHALGDADRADDELRRMTMVAEDIGSHDTLYLLRSCQARLALARGDDDEAGRQLRLLRDYEPAALPSFVEVPEVTRAQWLLHQGTAASLHEADAIARRLRQVAAARRTARSHVRAEIVQALLLQARGDAEGALVVLEDVVALTRQNEVVRLLVDLGTPMQRLLAEMLRLGSSPDPYLTRVLAAFPESIEPLGATAPLRRAAGAPMVDALTQREQEVLTLLASRLSDSEIADALNISIWTVKKHATTIYQKLQVGSRRDAVARAHALGLLPDNDRTR
jgi:LuxR family maltose regulon positive regulatory protein